MKKVLFALPVVLAALLFSYCSKESARPEMAAAPVNTGVSDRDGGHPCQVTISANGYVEICGLANNTNTCTDCLSNTLVGTDSGVGPFNYSVTPPYLGTLFCIRNPSKTNDVQVIITTSAFPPTPWTIPSGECYEFSVASTCFLWGGHAPDN